MASRFDNWDPFSITGKYNGHSYRNIEVGDPPKNNCIRHHRDVPNTTVIIFNKNSLLCSDVFFYEIDSVCKILAGSKPIV